MGTGPTAVVDQNAGRPGRQYQWSIGIQRQLTKDFLVEASYVGNRQNWLIATNMLNYNYVSNDILKAKLGL